jgi:hypothetical protein
VFKVTITTFLYTPSNVFSEIMIVGQEATEVIRLLSVECQPTKAVLPHTCMGVVFIRQWSDTILTMIFLPKSLADGR